MDRTTSPVIKKDKKQDGKPTTLDFYQAMKEVSNGKKIHKLEWEDKGYHGCLNKDEILVLRKPDGKDYTWTLSLGDIAGDDYIVID